MTNRLVLWKAVINQIILEDTRKINKKFSERMDDIEVSEFPLDTLNTHKVYIVIILLDLQDARSP
jgi:hypothetical protein